MRYFTTILSGCNLLDKLDAQLDSKFKVFLGICLSSLYDQCHVSFDQF
jgi:hypothetical protein